MKRTLLILVLALAGCASNNYSSLYSEAHLAEVAEVASHRLSSRTPELTQIPYEGVSLIWVDVEDLTARAFRDHKVIALPAYCIEQPGSRHDRD